MQWNRLLVKSQVSVVAVVRTGETIGYVARIEHSVASVSQGESIPSLLHPTKSTITSAKTL